MQLVATSKLSGHWQQQRDKIIGRYEYILSVELANIVEVLALSYICSYTSTLTAHYSSLRHLYGRLTARYKAPKISECINVQRWTDQENTPTWPNVLLSKYATLVNNAHWWKPTNRCTLANNRGPDNGIWAKREQPGLQRFTLRYRYVCQVWQTTTKRWSFHFTNMIGASTWLPAENCRVPTATRKICKVAGKKCS